MTSPNRPELHVLPVIAWLLLVGGLGIGLGTIAGQGIAGLTVAGLTVLAGLLAYLGYSSRRLRILCWVAASIAAMAAVAATAFPITSGTTPSPQGSEVAKQSADSPLTVATSWPSLPSCDEASAAAVPAGLGGPSDFHSQTDLRPQLVAMGGGSWQRGFYQMDLSSVTGESIEIMDIKPHIVRKDLSPPVWAFRSGGGCGGGVSRTFKFDLDTPSFQDEGVGGGVDGVTTPADVPTTALGPAFIIGGDEHAALNVDASVCSGNYEWNITIDYLTKGDSSIRQLTLPSLTSYGLGNNTLIYSGQDATGGIQSKPIGTVTGQSCRGAQGSAAATSTPAAADLPSVVTSSEQPANTGTVGIQPFVGTWSRHTSALEISADGSASILLGSGCCNSVSFPLSVAASNNNTALATVSGPSSYIGESFKDLDVPVGSNLTLHFGESDGGGLVLLSTNPSYGQPGVTEKELVWCSETSTDARCGA